MRPQNCALLAYGLIALLTEVLEGTIMKIAIFIIILVHYLSCLIIFELEYSWISILYQKIKTKNNKGAFWLNLDNI